MPDTIITVENLSKKYLIQHQQKECYACLRDVIADKAKSVWQKIKKPTDGFQHKNQIEEFWALKEVSFEIKKGETVGIIGRNGAGKSTLLKLLARITEPTTGKIHLRGRVASLLEVGTGFHPELTGRENIFLNGAILGMTREEIRRKFDEIVAFAEVEKFLDTPVKRYSSGMYVRLAFAVAAHLEPEILLVDEVLAVGDAEFQKKCLGKMGDVARKGRTVLFVSHNMNAIERLCNKVIIIHQGRIKKIGNDVQDIIHQYILKASDKNSLNDVEWINTDKKFKNDYFMPTRFAIEKHNKTLQKNRPNIFSNNEEFKIRIEGISNQPHNALCVGYAISTSNGQLLYWTYHTDVSRKNWPKIKKGKNILVSHFPKNLLNEGTYKIELLISLHYIKWICEPHQNAPAIYFTIQGGLSDSPYWMVKRPGLLAPIIKWETA